MNNKKQTNALDPELDNDKSYQLNQTASAFVTLINITMKQMSFKMNMRGFYSYVIVLCLSMFVINLSKATKNVYGLHGYMGSYEVSRPVDSEFSYGIAQLSNKLIVPPDSLTFKGNQTASYLAMDMSHCLLHKSVSQRITAKSIYFINT
ncbi:hypothetical protein [Thalassotalea ganghwensis]